MAESGVSGERAQAGSWCHNGSRTQCPTSCPAGEDCSDKTPYGLFFAGHVFYDTYSPQLGPILSGGTFNVFVRPSNSMPMPAFKVVVEDPSVLEVDHKPATSYGYRSYVDQTLTVTGKKPGASYIRVVDADTGKLFDRLKLEVYKLENVTVSDAARPGESGFIAGCEAMIAVQLHAKNDKRVTTRAFDQSVNVTVDGQKTGIEPDIWDCFTHDVDKDAKNVDVHVEAAGKSFDINVPVKTRQQEGLTECPAVMD